MVLYLARIGAVPEETHVWCPAHLTVDIHSKSAMTKSFSHLWVAPLVFVNPLTDERGDDVDRT